MSSWDSSAVHEHDTYQLKKQNITPKLELHTFSLVFLFFQFTPEPDFSSFTSSQKQESNYNVST